MSTPSNALNAEDIASALRDLDKYVKVSVRFTNKRAYKKLVKQLESVHPNIEVIHNTVHILKPKEN